MPSNDLGETAADAVQAVVEETTSNGQVKTEVNYRANVRPKMPLHPEMVSSIREIEQILGAPVVLYLQDESDNTYWGMVADEAFMGLYEADLPQTPVVLLLHSLGGFADAAYQTVNVLRERCGGFTVLVPNQAKSAATLIAMGGQEILMRPLSHLGPIDPQIFDFDSHDRKSALETVQAVERLRSEALETLGHAMTTMIGGTNLSQTTLLPFAVELTTGLMRPLLEKVDVNQYMRMSRSMKVGEEYAVRIMEPIYGGHKARQIASYFSQNYPEHGFIIRPEEVRKQGLNVKVIEGELLSPLLKLDKYIGQITAYGCLEEVK